MVSYIQVVFLIDINHFTNICDDPAELETYKVKINLCCLRLLTEFGALTDKGYDKVRWSFKFYNSRIFKPDTTRKVFVDFNRTTLEELYKEIDEAIKKIQNEKSKNEFLQSSPKLRSSPRHKPSRLNILSENEKDIRPFGLQTDRASLCHSFILNKALQEILLDYNWDILDISSPVKRCRPKPGRHSRLRSKNTVDFESTEELNFAVVFTHVPTSLKELSSFSGKTGECLPTDFFKSIFDPTTLAGYKEEKKLRFHLVNMSERKIEAELRTQLQSDLYKIYGGIHEIENLIQVNGINRYRTNPTSDHLNGDSSSLDFIYCHKGYKLIRSLDAGIYSKHWWNIKNIISRSRPRVLQPGPVLEWVDAEGISFLRIKLELLSISGSSSVKWGTASVCGVVRGDAMTLISNGLKSSHVYVCHSQENHFIDLLSVLQEQNLIMILSQEDDGFASLRPWVGGVGCFIVHSVTGQNLSVIKKNSSASNTDNGTEALYDSAMNMVIQKCLKDSTPVSSKTVSDSPRNFQPQMLKSWFVQSQVTTQKLPKRLGTRSQLQQCMMERIQKKYRPQMPRPLSASHLPPPVLIDVTEPLAAAAVPNVLPVSKPEMSRAQQLVKKSKIVTAQMKVKEQQAEEQEQQAASERKMAESKQRSKKSLELVSKALKNASNPQDKDELANALIRLRDDSDSLIQKIETNVSCDSSDDDLYTTAQTIINVALTQIRSNNATSSIESDLKDVLSRGVLRSAKQVSNSLEGTNQLRQFKLQCLLHLEMLWVLGYSSNGPSCGTDDDDGVNVKTNLRDQCVEEILKHLRTMSLRHNPSSVVQFLQHLVVPNYQEFLGEALVEIYEELNQPLPSSLRAFADCEELETPVKPSSVKSSGSSICNIPSPDDINMLAVKDGGRSRKPLLPRVPSSRQIVVPVIKRQASKENENKKLTPKKGKGQAKTVCRNLFERAAKRNREKLKWKRSHTVASFGASSSAAQRTPGKSGRGVDKATSKRKRSVSPYSKEAITPVAKKAKVLVPETPAHRVSNTIYSRRRLHKSTGSTIITESPDIKSVSSSSGNYRRTELTRRGSFYSGAQSRNFEKGKKQLMASHIQGKVERRSSLPASSTTAASFLFSEIIRSTNNRSERGHRNAVVGVPECKRLDFGLDDVSHNGSLEYSPANMLQVSAKDEIISSPNVKVHRETPLRKARRTLSLATPVKNILPDTDDGYFANTGLSLSNKKDVTVQSSLESDPQLSKSKAFISCFTPGKRVQFNLTYTPSKQNYVGPSLTPKSILKTPSKSPNESHTPKRSVMMASGTPSKTPRKSFRNSVRKSNTLINSLSCKTPDKNSELQESKIVHLQRSMSTSPVACGSKDHNFPYMTVDIDASKEYSVKYSSCTKELSYILSGSFGDSVVMEKPSFLSEIAESQNFVTEESSDVLDSAAFGCHTPQSNKEHKLDSTAKQTVTPVENITNPGITLKTFSPLEMLIHAPILTPKQCNSVETKRLLGSKSACSSLNSQRYRKLSPFSSPRADGERLSLLKQLSMSPKDSSLSGCQRTGSTAYPESSNTLASMEFEITSPVKSPTKRLHRATKHSSLGKSPLFKKRLLSLDREGSVLDCLGSSSVQGSLVMTDGTSEDISWMGSSSSCKADVKRKSGHNDESVDNIMDKEGTFDRPVVSPVIKQLEEIVTSVQIEDSKLENFITVNENSVFRFLDPVTKNGRTPGYSSKTTSETDPSPGENDYQESSINQEDVEMMTSLLWDSVPCDAATSSTSIQSTMQTDFRESSHPEIPESLEMHPHSKLVSKASSVASLQKTSESEASIKSSATFIKFKPINSPEFLGFETQNICSTRNVIAFKEQNGQKLNNVVADNITMNDCSFISTSSVDASNDNCSLFHPFKGLEEETEQNTSDSNLSRIIPLDPKVKEFIEKQLTIVKEGEASVGSVAANIEARDQNSSNNETKFDNESLEAVADQEVTDEMMAVTGIQQVHVEKNQILPSDRIHISKGNLMRYDANLVSCDHKNLVTDGTQMAYNKRHAVHDNNQIVYENISGPDDVVYENISGPDDVVYENISGPDDVVYENISGPDDVVYENISGPDDVVYENISGPDEMGVIADVSQSVLGWTQVTDETRKISDASPVAVEKETKSNTDQIMYEEIWTVNDASQIPQSNNETIQNENKLVCSENCDGLEKEQSLCNENQLAYNESQGAKDKNQLTHNKSLEAQEKNQLEYNESYGAKDKNQLAHNESQGTKDKNQLAYNESQGARDKNQLAHNECQGAKDKNQLAHNECQTVLSINQFLPDKIYSVYDGNLKINETQTVHNENGIIHVEKISSEKEREGECMNLLSDFKLIRTPKHHDENKTILVPDKEGTVQGDAALEYRDGVENLVDTKLHNDLLKSTGRGIGSGCLLTLSNNVAERVVNAESSYNNTAVGCAVPAIANGTTHPTAVCVVPTIANGTTHATAVCVVPAVANGSNNDRHSVNLDKRSNFEVSNTSSICASSPKKAKRIKLVRDNSYKTYIFKNIGESGGKRTHGDQKLKKKKKKKTNVSESASDMTLCGNNKLGVTIPYYDKKRLLVETEEENKKLKKPVSPHHKDRADTLMGSELSAPLMSERASHKNHEFSCEQDEGVCLKTSEYQENRFSCQNDIRSLAEITLCPEKYSCLSHEMPIVSPNRGDAVLCNEDSALLNYQNNVASCYCSNLLTSSRSSHEVLVKSVVSSSQPLSCQNYLLSQQLPTRNHEKSSVERETAQVNDFSPQMSVTEKMKYTSPRKVNLLKIKCISVNLSSHEGNNAFAVQEVTRKSGNWIKKRKTAQKSKCISLQKNGHLTPRKETSETSKFLSPQQLGHLIPKMNSPQKSKCLSQNQLTHQESGHLTPKNETLQKCLHASPQKLLTPQTSGHLTPKKKTPLKRYASPQKQLTPQKSGHLTPKKKIPQKNVHASPQKQLTPLKSGHLTPKKKTPMKSGHLTPKKKTPLKRCASPQKQLTPQKNGHLTPKKKTPQKNVHASPQKQLTPLKSGHLTPKKKTPQKSLCTFPQKQLTPQTSGRLTPQKKSLCASPQKQLTPQKRHFTPKKKTPQKRLCASPQKQLTPQKSGHLTPKKKTPQKNLCASPQKQLTPQKSGHLTPKKKTPQKNLCASPQKQVTLDKSGHLTPKKKTPQKNLCASPQKQVTLDKSGHLTPKKKTPQKNLYASPQKQLTPQKSGHLTSKRKTPQKSLCTSPQKELTSQKSEHLTPEKKTHQRSLHASSQKQLTPQTSEHLTPQKKTPQKRLHSSSQKQLTPQKRGHLTLKNKTSQKNLCASQKQLTPHKSGHLTPKKKNPQKNLYASPQKSGHLTPKQKTPQKSLCTSPQKQLTPQKSEHLTSLKKTHQRSLHASSQKQLTPQTSGHLTPQKKTPQKRLHSSQKQLTPQKRGHLTPKKKTPQKNLYASPQKQLTPQKSGHLTPKQKTPQKSLCTSPQKEQTPQKSEHLTPEKKIHQRSLHASSQKQLTPQTSGHLTPQKKTPQKRLHSSQKQLTPQKRGHLTPKKKTPQKCLHSSSQKQLIPQKSGHMDKINENSQTKVLLTQKKKTARKSKCISLQNLAPQTIGQITTRRDTPQKNKYLSMKKTAQKTMNSSPLREIVQKSKFSSPDEMSSQKSKHFCLKNSSTQQVENLSQTDVCTVAYKQSKRRSKSLSSRTEMSYSRYDEQKCSEYESGIISSHLPAENLSFCGFPSEEEDHRPIIKDTCSKNDVFVDVIDQPLIQDLQLLPPVSDNLHDSPYKDHIRHDELRTPTRRSKRLKVEISTPNQPSPHSFGVGKKTPGRAAKIGVNYNSDYLDDIMNDIDALETTPTRRQRKTPKNAIKKFKELDYNEIMDDTDNLETTPTGKQRKLCNNTVKKLKKLDHDSVRNCNVAPETTYKRTLRNTPERVAKSLQRIGNSCAKRNCLGEENEERSTPRLRETLCGKDVVCKFFNASKITPKEISVYLGKRCSDTCVRNGRDNKEPVSGVQKNNDVSVAISGWSQGEEQPLGNASRIAKNIRQPTYWESTPKATGNHVDGKGCKLLSGVLNFLSPVHDSATPTTSRKQQGTSLQTTKLGRLGRSCLLQGSKPSFLSRSHTVQFDGFSSVNESCSVQSVAPGSLNESHDSQSVRDGGSASLVGNGISENSDNCSSVTSTRNCSTFSSVYGKNLSGSYEIVSPKKTECEDVSSSDSGSSDTEASKKKNSPLILRIRKKKPKRPSRESKSKALENMRLSQL